MTRASRLFYLSFFAIFAPVVHCQDAPDACATSPQAIVSDACASYSSLELLNRNVGPWIAELTNNTDFFAYYRLNLFNKECPFWNDENGMCGNIACAVETLDDEKDIPEVWRASELGRLQGPLATHPPKQVQKIRPKDPLQGGLGLGVGESCVVEYDDECDELDYCVPEDESATSKGDYVSLVQNPERFTGYAGVGARLVWDAIYSENCFQKSSFPHHAALPPPQEKGPAERDFKSMLQAADRQQQLEHTPNFSLNQPLAASLGGQYTEDECVEKRVFYRIISGMHTSISTHICSQYLDQMTGKWQPNVTCYMDRLHNHPDRISNLYFNYALVTRAIAKLGPYLQDYTFCTGDAAQDKDTKEKVWAVTQNAGSIPQIFDESLMFKNGEGPSLKEDFRNRFRNVSRLMDCVGCDKCRLWGKVQTNGYGAALKVLFEFDNESQVIPHLKRTELVALFNTYARLSSSLDLVQKFRAMVTEKEAAGEQTQATQPIMISDRAKKPHHVVIPPDAPRKSAPLSTEDEAKKKDEQIEHGPPPTIKDEFDDELAKVMDALKLVVRGWLDFPQTVWFIVKSEARRAWRSYIGLPVSQTRYTFKWRTKDEL